MISLGDFSIDRLREIGISSFRVRLAGSTGVEYQGYNIANEGIYHLYYVQDITVILENGTSIKDGTGFLISKDWQNKPYQMGVAFYDFTGVAYSQIPQERLEEIIVDFNNSVTGDEAETTEEKEGRTFRKESLEDERERLEEEARAAEEEYLEKARTPINEEVVLREQELVFNREDAGLSRTTNLKLIQITTGTELNPVVSYRVVEEYQGRETFSQTADSQEQAEIIYQTFIDEMTEEFDKMADESAENIRLNTPLETRPYSKTEFYFVESPYTFQEMLTTTNPNFDYQPIWQRTLARGNSGEAVTFTDGGNTLKLDDFDMPRFTLEGIEENKSAGVGFTVRQNWKITFRLEGDSNIRMLRDSKVEGVNEVNSQTFEFTLYSGDTLQIDIDNEYPSLRPFYASIAGKEWYSAIEIDDEVELTLIKAERLMVKHESGFETVYPEGSPKPNEFNVEFEYEGQAYGENQSPYAKELLEKYPQFQEVSRDISAPLPEAESSFVSPTDVREQVGEVGQSIVDTTVAAGESVIEGAGDVAGTFFDRFKWWILGGVIVLGIVVYLRFRKPNVAPPQQVIVAEKPSEGE